MYLEEQTDLQVDFGPTVHEGPIRRRNAVRHGFTSRDNGPRKTEAFLVAHLTSHTDAITSIAMAPDHAFFVTASDDQETAWQCPEHLHGRARAQDSERDFSDAVARLYTDAHFGFCRRTFFHSSVNK